MGTSTRFEAALAVQPAPSGGHAEIGKPSALSCGHPAESIYALIMSVGRQLAEARHDAGLSQRELAHRAGVPLSTVGRIERGTVSPTVQTLERLAEALGGRASFVFATSLLELIRAHATAVERICARHGAHRPRVFGSVARGEDLTTSDLDLMVDLEEDADLLSLVRIERDLAELLGVDVDVVPRSAMGEGMRRVADAEAVRL